ncbi:MAG TPA: hypothetical protein PLO56_14865 [Rhodothermales bacterium]|nr:hypothetical protein [Rhodothermales bacterium]
MKQVIYFFSFLFSSVFSLLYAQDCREPSWANDLDFDKDAPEGWIVRVGVGESSEISKVRERAFQNAALAIAQSVKLRVDSYNQEVVQGADHIDLVTLEEVTRFSVQEELVGLRNLAASETCQLRNGKYRKYLLVAYHVDKFYVDRIRAYERTHTPTRPPASNSRGNSSNRRRTKPNTSSKPTSSKPTSSKPTSSKPTSCTPTKPRCYTAQPSVKRRTESVERRQSNNITFRLGKLIEDPR